MKTNKMKIIILTTAIMAFAIKSQGITIIPNYLDGYAEWTEERKGVIQQAINDWQTALPDNHVINVNFNLLRGGSDYVAIWQGYYSPHTGENIYPWAPQMVHTIHFNADLFSGSNYIWWDPSPSTSDDIPTNGWDALTLARREIGGMLGFIKDYYFDNFNIDGASYDKWSSHIVGDTFDPNGLNIPMRSGDARYVLDRGPTTGDLMVSSLPTHVRRDISAIDLKMLHLAYNYTIPEPSTIALLLTATLGGLLLWRRRR